MSKAGTRGDRLLLGRLVAATELIQRTGATEFEIAYDDETGYDRVPVVWWTTAKWNGQRLDSEFFPYPAQAAEDLLSRVINGGLCKRCEKTTVVGLVVDGCCSFVLHAGDVDDDQTYRYVRTCESEAT